MLITMQLKTFKLKKRTVILSTIYAAPKNRVGSSATFSPKKWLIGLFVLASILLALNSCEAPFENPSANNFIIYKGDYYASPRRFERFQAASLLFTAQFDKSAIYEMEISGGETHRNILMGFTDCGSLYDANSARFDWRWFNGGVDIYAHGYKDGVPAEEHLGAVNLNEENRYEIAVTEGQYVFYLNGEQKTRFERFSGCDNEGNYMLFPYFGGPEPAPHNIEIKIQMLH